MWIHKYFANFLQKPMSGINQVFVMWSKNLYTNHNEEGFSKVQYLTHEFLKFRMCLDFYRTNRLIISCEYTQTWFKKKVRFVSRMSRYIKSIFCLWVSIHKYLYIIQSIHLSVVKNFGHAKTNSPNWFCNMSRLNWAMMLVCCVWVIIHRRMFGSLMP